MYISLAESAKEWIYDHIKNDQSGDQGSFRKYLHTQIYSDPIINPTKLEKAKKTYKKILNCYDNFQNNPSGSEKEFLIIKNKIIKLKNKIDKILDISVTESTDLIIHEMKKGDQKRVLELLQNIKLAHLKNTNIIWHAVKYGMRDVAKLLMKHHELDFKEINEIIESNKESEESIIFFIQQLDLPPSFLTFIAKYILDNQFIQLFKMALEKGAFQNITNPCPLYSAVQCKNIGMVKELLKAGFKPEVQYRGKNCLMEALRLKHSEIAKLLLTEEAIKAFDKEGKTPLHFAVNSNLMEFIPLLIERGLNPNERNYLGKTPLAFSSSVEITQLLIKLGGEVKTVDDQGNNLLYEAFYRINPELVSFFLQLGFDINAQNYEGETPLHQFIKYAEPSKQDEKARLDWLSIFNEVKKLNYDVITPSSNQDSPLMIVTRNDSTDFFEEFLNKSKWQINFTNNDGETALSLALQKSNENFTLQLMRNGADIFLKNSEGIPFIETAINKKMYQVIREVIKNNKERLKAQIGNIKFFKILIACKLEEEALEFFKQNFNDYYKDYRDTTDNLRSLLFTAMEADNTKMVHLLIDQGINLNAPDGLSVTPLHASIRSKKFELAKKLIECGADVNAEDGFRNTPLHDAILYKQPELVELLIRKGADNPNLYGFKRSSLAKSMGIDVSPYITKKEKKTADRIEWLKLLANCWSISHRTSIDYFSFENKGGFEPLYQMHLLNYLERYQEKKVAENLFSRVKEDFASHTVNENLTAEDILNKMNSGKTMIFQAGPDKHVISIMFTQVGQEYFMFVTNRGNCREKSYIKCFNINQNISLEQAQEILKLNTRLDNEDWNSFIYDILPANLGFHKDNQRTLPKILDTLIGRYQQMGNCWQVSLKALIRVMLICYLCEKLDTSSIDYHEKVEKAVTDSLPLYKQFTEFLRIEMLKDYLKFRLEDLTQNPPEKLPYDHELIQKIASKVYYRRKWKYPIDLEEINRLLDQYEKMTRTVIIR